MPLGEWLKKMYICTIEYYSGIKGIKICCLQVNEWRTLLSTISQAQNVKCCMFSLISGIYTYKINIHRNAHMIIYVSIYLSVYLSIYGEKMIVLVGLSERTPGRKERE
jgi:hypothetical protein